MTVVSSGPYRYRNRGAYCLRCSVASWRIPGRTHSGIIAGPGVTAFHWMEEELDWLEMADGRKAGSETLETCYGISLTRGQPEHRWGQRERLWVKVLSDTGMDASPIPVSMRNDAARSSAGLPF